jgi:lipid II:glycine glycyltransferase (peptidoglycan interpeptide bridge formation enzyme)
LAGELHLNTHGEWALIHDRQTWSDLITRVGDAPVFQSWGWGEFQRRSGWRPLRFHRINPHSHDVTLAQVLCRKMPGGIEFAWIPGGPVATRMNGLAEDMKLLYAALEDEVGRCFMRCNVMQPTTKTEFFARNSFMVRAKRQVNSRYSVYLQLSGTADEWLTAMSKKHRYYVRQANKHGIEWSTGTDDASLATLANLLQQMVSEKQIHIPIYSLEQLKLMRQELGAAMTVIVGHHNGQAVSGALVVSQGARAHYLAAATTQHGRTLSAAYGMMFALRNHLMGLGITLFDLGGIAPHDRRASGVDHFKLGFGGETVEYLGEWDAGSRISRTLGNSAVARIIRGTQRGGTEFFKPADTQWERWEGSDIDWDATVRTCAGASVYQSHRWGKHRQQFGWTPIRMVARRNGRVVAMIQVQTRRYLSFVGLVWSPGGPVGDLAECGREMRRAISRAIGARYVVFRLNTMRPYDDGDAAMMSRQGWINSQETILSGLSLVYDLTTDATVRESLSTKNWRHNLKRSLKRPIVAYHWVNPSADEMKNVYDAMHSYKGIEHLAQQNSLSSIQSLISLFGDDCIIVRCDDAEGNMLALRGALVMGDLAWDTFAAATPEGRKSYASYRAFWELMEICRQRGVRSYDLGGADPINNKGVYDFKQGTGANVVRFLGEWEHSQPPVLGKIVGRRLAARLG